MASINFNKQTEIRGPVLTGKILGPSAGPELQKVWKSWTVRISTLVKSKRSKIFKFSTISLRIEVPNYSRSDLSFSQTGPRVSVCLLEFMDICQFWPSPWISGLKSPLFMLAKWNIYYHWVIFWQSLIWPYPRLSPDMRLSLPWSLAIISTLPPL